MQRYISNKNQIEITFKYPDIEDKLFSDIRKLTNLNIDDSISEIEKVKTIAGYVHNLFPHDGNSPSPSEKPLDIIKKAKEGISFRCVEYSIVAGSILWAFNIPARVVGLKTKDMAIRESNAGHVVVEFWSNKFQKWIMCDVQAGIIPFYEGVHLSAFELGETLNKGLDPVYLPVEYSHFLSENKEEYSHWIKQYLYFLDFPIEINFNKGLGVKKIMLVPVGVEPPKFFQRDIPINAEYTSSILDFYRPYKK